LYQRNWTNDCHAPAGQCHVYCCRLQCVCGSTIDLHPRSCEPIASSLGEWHSSLLWATLSGCHHRLSTRRTLESQFHRSQNVRAAGYGSQSLPEESLRGECSDCNREYHR